MESAFFGRSIVFCGLSSPYFGRSICVLWSILSLVYGTLWSVNYKNKRFQEKLHNKQDDNMNEKMKFMLQELESDDELPDSYNDAEILPAYMDNSRFDAIKFPWLKHTKIKAEVPKSETNSRESVRFDRILCHEGILKSQDLYCLKAIEPYTSSTTLIWFLNYMLYKDLLSKYTHLKSCLVSDLSFTNPFTKQPYRGHIEKDTKKRFEIRIKD